MSSAERRAREVVGVFSDGYVLESAVEELLNSGFDLSDISLLAGEKAIVGKLGHKYEKVEAAEDDGAAPRVAYAPREALSKKRARSSAVLSTSAPPWRPARRSRQAEPSRCFS